MLELSQTQSEEVMHAAQVDNFISWLAAMDQKSSFLRRFSEPHSTAITDASLVFLGLKPVAYLGYNGDRELLTSIPSQFPSPMRTDIGFIHFSKKNGLIWSPAQVRRTLLIHLNHFSPWQHAFNLDQITTDPECCVAFLSAVISCKHVALEAVLYGYPKVVGELFQTYHAKILPAADTLWALAFKHQYSLSCPQPPSTISELVNNGRHTKTQLLQLADYFPYAIDSDLLTYIKRARLAKVPGFHYLTLGDITKAAETRLTAAYEASGVKTKIQQLINK